MLRECGKSNAGVQVLTDPKMGGFENARSRLPEVVERYSHFDLLLFMVDADGKDRTPAFETLEGSARQRNVHLLCCAAEQEVEVWLLAGHRDKLHESWDGIRADTAVKENVFDAFLASYGDPRRHSGGRDVLMNETLSNYRSLKQLCPELAQLERRVRRLLGPE